MVQVRLSAREYRRRYIEAPAAPGRAGDQRAQQRLHAMIAARFGASYRVESEYTVATIEGSRAGRYRIDTAFPDQRLGIELDGFRFHARFPSAFKRHLARQNRLVGAGWRLLRYTRGELADIETILQQIQRVLQSQGSGEENQR